MKWLEKATDVVVVVGLLAAMVTGVVILALAGLSLVL